MFYSGWSMSTCPQEILLLLNRKSVNVQTAQQKWRSGKMVARRSEVENQRLEQFIRLFIRLFTLFSSIPLYYCGGSSIVASPRMDKVAGTLWRSFLNEQFYILLKSPFVRPVENGRHFAVLEPYSRNIWVKRYSPVSFEMRMCFSHCIEWKWTKWNILHVGTCFKLFMNILQVISIWNLFLVYIFFCYSDTIVHEWKMVECLLEMGNFRSEICWVVNSGLYKYWYRNNYLSKSTFW